MNGEEKGQMEGREQEKWQMGLGVGRESREKENFKQVPLSMRAPYGPQSQELGL